MQPDNIWTSFELAPGETLVWDVGATCIYASRTDNDWLIARTESEERDTAEIKIHKDPIPEDLSPERWAFKSSHNTIKFAPVMPNRPIVVRPIAPLGLPPESEVQFYINIPAFIRVTIAAKSQETEVGVYPSQTLSNTWFGDNFSGVFCYSNKTKIRREKAELTVVPNQIICPFKIKNKGDEILNVERICLRVKYLSIWAGKQRLWSNEVTTIFRGHGKETQLQYAASAPKDAFEPRLIEKSQEKPERGFLRQTFAHAPFPWRKESDS